MTLYWYTPGRKSEADSHDLASHAAQKYSATDRKFEIVDPSNICLCLVKISVYKRAITSTHEISNSTFFFLIQI